MHLRFSLSMLALLLVSQLSPKASADIIVSFGPLNPNPIAIGGSGTIDVFARTDVGTVALDGFQLQLLLTPTGGSPAGGLVFTDPQSDTQLTVGGPNGYVFFGNSLSENTAVPIGAVTNSGSTFTGFDSTFDFVPMTLTTSNRLLYRLDLTSVAAGTYDITANTGLLDSFFSDQNDPTNTSINFTTETASLTTSPAAVPEPSSILVLAMGSGAIGFHRLRRKRREASIGAAG